MAYESGAHWALYQELKARVKALGLRAEHCAFPVLNYKGRCIAICAQNKYEYDCTGIKRESTREIDRRLKAERELH